MRTFDKAMSELAPASQNNSREIVRGWIRKFRWSPSRRHAERIENVLGIDIDFSDADHGEPPALETNE